MNAQLADMQYIKKLTHYSKNIFLIFSLFLLYNKPFLDLCIFFSKQNN